MAQCWSLSRLADPPAAAVAESAEFLDIHVDPLARRDMRDQQLAAVHGQPGSASRADQPEG